MNRFCMQMDFSFPSIQTAKNAVISLKPDLNQKHEKNSKTILKANKNVVSVNIIAWNEKRLNSTSNSIIKAIALIQKIQSIKKESW